MTDAQAFFTLYFPGTTPLTWKARLDRTLPMTPFSWNPELLIWGNREMTSLEVWMENGGPTHGQLRLDLRAPDLNFLSLVLDFAKEFNLSIEDEKGAWVPSTLDGIRLGIERSAALRTIANPNELLGRLGTTRA